MRPRDKNQFGDMIRRCGHLLNVQYRFVGRRLACLRLRLGRRRVAQHQRREQGNRKRKNRGQESRGAAKQREALKVAAAPETRSDDRKLQVARRASAVFVSPPACRDRPSLTRTTSASGSARARLRSTSAPTDHARIRA